MMAKKCANTYKVDIQSCMVHYLPMFPQRLPLWFANKLFIKRYILILLQLSVH